MKKWFVIASEGATTDGRQIDRAWLEQMAKNYDPAKYTARINLEHYRGIDPEGLFRAYGDVVALKTEERDGKLVLLAQLDPTADLVALTKKRQKIFTSMEVSTKFADTDQAYLMGLAVTDSPASLSTEMLEFSAAKGAAGPLESRKQAPDNLFSAAIETALKFDDEPATAAAQLFSAAIDKLTALVEKFGAKAEPAKPAVTVDAAAPTADFSAFAKGAIDAIKAMQTEVVAKADFTALQGQYTQLQQELTDLRHQLEADPAHSYSQRPPATGGNGVKLTDC